MAMYPSLQGGGGDALYEECKNKILNGTPTALTVYNNRVDDVTGGYIKEGKVVWLYIKCRVTGQGGLDSAGFLRNVGAPWAATLLMDAPIPYNKAFESGGTHGSCYCAISESGGVSYTANADSDGTSYSATKILIVPTGSYFEMWAKYSSAS